jgi:hypothetical protein
MLHGRFCAQCGQKAAALNPSVGEFLHELVSRRSGRNYPQHLYFALHVHAGWFFAGAVALAVVLPVVFRR